MTNAFSQSLSRSLLVAGLALAGTVLRFVPPVAAQGSGHVVFDGDEQAKIGRASCRERV